ncbi:multicomponent Na+:H+ antiporter subunit C [Natronospira proteinivora]|uniref:Multicomponent Na+:H+ antiporter subunit C n=1 Tax=Natronospira proteinivora TaxID=1807133 RepID=A0ABT1G630_9GAMM|nr:cation:proton antiporter subunit C [Natronospira proteinivora]MCP1726750.1 multicomponent Na+:H+ antiporter subunit C [Natronospira proteinivora]
MSAALFTLTAAALFGLGLYGVLTRQALIHRLLGANIMATAVFLFLIVLSAKHPEDPDPVPQAMVLTGIVIAVSLTAFALALIRYFHALSDAQSDQPEGGHRGGD